MSRAVLRVVAAWGVHLLTATGAIWGFLALRAIFDHAWRLAFAWMLIAMLVDGLDGYLARTLDVQTHAARLDGSLLDNIVDYLNYVIVPALLLIEAPSLLPNGFRLAAALLVLLCSAYQFSQVDAKTEDHYFKGFPSYWNVVAVYLLLLNLNPWLNLAIVVLLNILVFVPVKYVYPSRSERFRRLTVVLTCAFGAIAVFGLLQYPAVPAWTIWLSALYVLYYLGISLLPSPQKIQPYSSR